MELIIRSNNMQEVEGVTAEYPYVLNRADSASIRVPWHWHEEVEFSYVRRGTLRVAVSGHSYEFGEGEGFFLNSNILHTMDAADPQAGVLWDSHMFHPTFLGGQYRSIFDTKYLSPITKNKKFELVEFRGENEAQREILRLMREAADAQEDEFAEFRTRSLFSEVWLHLMRELRDPEAQAKLPKPISQERIQTMLEYIHRHFSEKLTLEQIAASAIISGRECLRCFQSCIHKTPFEYLLDYRVQVAERLLRTTDLSITEIALQTGFSDSAYFSRQFRELRKMSPSQYRKNR
ncbi:MAG: AraC family transcriptional regulator [Oscillospiraceae bacterium]|nr:AraC family transcriptional regulator [Oscillospiraceae bacterium]